MEIPAPMPANVIEVLVSVGDKVEVDQELVILESMKMEVPVPAPEAGRVTEVLVEVGQAVSEGDVILRIE